MLKNYFKSAWRGLWKNKATAAINITGLAVGMTAAILIFLWVQNEMNFDTYHKDADQVYRLTTNLKENNWVWESSPLLLADAIKKDVPEIESTTRLFDGNWPVFNINNHFTFEKTAAYVDDSWFTIFRYDFIKGNASSFMNDDNSIVLTESTAKKYFGNADVLGTIIHVDSMNYTVKGIVKDAPANSSFHYTAFFPLANLLKDPGRRANDEQWQNANYISFVKIKPTAVVAAVSNKINAVFASRSGDKETFISLMPLKDMHFENEVQNSVFVHGNKNTVYIFTLLAVLLLLIACINYVNLTTAKASLRAKEISIRKVVGADRIHLFYQFIAEAMLVSLIAVFITLLLIQVCLPAFNNVTTKNFELPLSSLSMWKVIGLTLFSALILNSIYPALVLSSFQPLKVIKGFTVLKGNDSYFRKGLVIMQFGFSVMLIAGTIIIYRQMDFIQKTDAGYNRSQVLSFPLPPDAPYKDKQLLIQEIKQELLSQSSIQNVSVANQSIVNIGSYSTGAADWEGHDTTFNPKIAQLSIDADFAATMQLQMKEGRWFRQGNQSDRRNVVLNEEAVKELNLRPPYIGQRFTFKGNTGQIIGIVKDFKYKSMHDKTGPLIAFNNPDWYRFFMVRVAPGNTTQAINALQQAWKKFLPGSPLEYNFLDEAFNNLYKEELQVSSLMFAFALIAVAISCLGLFGLAAFTAEQRSKEIGIRKVLGASIVGITQLLTKDFLKLVMAAIIIASPIALWAMNGWLQGFAYRIDISWWMFALSGLIAVGVALITISWQAIRAAIANPVKSLRTE